jgi:hypothetical protein
MKRGPFIFLALLAALLCGSSAASKTFPPAVVNSSGDTTAIFGNEPNYG